MKAVRMHEYGGPEVLRYEDADEPICGDDEVLVRVRATSVNPIDIKIRNGSARNRMPVDLPAILGRDLAGEVVRSGGSVSGFAEGMRVMALANRTYAEYTAVKASSLAPIPEGMSFEVAASLPLVTSTGSQLMERAVRIAAGQTVLVTGALGGVGRSAVHVAIKHGAHVLAGVRLPEKEQALALKASGVVAVDNDGEIDTLHNLDAIADTVGGATIQRLLKTIRSGGVLGSVLGVPEGAANYDIRVEAFSAVPDAARLAVLAREAALGEFVIPIARTMELKDIQEAHRLAEAGGLRGKIVLLL